MYTGSTYDTFLKLIEKRRKELHTKIYKAKTLQISDIGTKME